MREMQHVRHIRLVPFCDSRCRICETIGCRSEKLASTEELTQIFQAAQDELTLVPHNLAYHPNRDSILEVASANGLNLRMVLPVDLLSGGRSRMTREFAVGLLKRGFGIELVFESCDESATFELIRQWKADFTGRVHFTFQLSRDRGTYSSYENIRRELGEQLSLFSPSKVESIDNRMTCDEIAEFLDDISASEKELSPPIARRFESAASSFQFERLQSRLHSGTHDWCAADFQHYYRQTMDRKFYLDNIQWMGSHRWFRTLLTVLSQLSMLKFFFSSLSRAVSIWLGPVFATESKYLNQLPNDVAWIARTVRKPFVLLSGLLVRYAVRSYYAVKAVFGKSWKLRVAMIRAYYRLSARIDALQIGGRLNSVRHHFVHAKSDPTGYLKMYCPLAHLLFVWPLLKSYYFIAYQWKKRVTGEVVETGSELPAESLRRE